MVMDAVHVEHRLSSHFFWVGLMYWLQCCNCLKFVKSRNLFIHLTWMEVSCVTALKVWICLRAMDDEDLFTVANLQGRALVMKTKYCPFLGIGLRSSESFVAWAQQCSFGKEGLVPRGCRASAAVSWDWCPSVRRLWWAPGVQEWNLASPAGLSPWRKLLQHQGVPTLPFQVKQCLIGFTFSNTKHEAKQIKFIPKSPSWNKIAPLNIPISLLNAVLQYSCYGEGRCWGEEWKNIKQIASIKQLLRWMSQICLVVLGLFIAVGFACDIVCRVTLHPSWLLSFFS